jgi:hypothetical protein
MVTEAPGGNISLREPVAERVLVREEDVAKGASAIHGFMLSLPAILYSCVTT